MTTRQTVDKADDEEGTGTLQKNEKDEDDEVLHVECNETLPENSWTFEQTTTSAMAAQQPAAAGVPQQWAAAQLTQPQPPQQVHLPQQQQQPVVPTLPADIAQAVADADELLRLVAQLESAGNTVLSRM